MPMTRIIMLATAMAAFAPSAALQAEDGTNAGQAAIDQQVDLALGTLDTLPTLRMSRSLQVPQERLGFSGPQPFDIEPPAAQSDFSDPAAPVGPRGSKL